MVEVSKKDGGFLFNNQFFFISQDVDLPQDVDDSIIFLKSHIGKDMNYQISIQNLIEYPWVYDFDDIHIICEWKTSILNFIIKTGKNSFAIVQDTNSIDGDNYEDIKDVFTINEIQLNKFLKLDIETNTVDLESIS